jgi:outer membrane protein assembly factor BamB
LKSFDKKTPTILWEVKKGEGYASPAVVGDSVILFHRLGNEEIIERLNAENGQRFWKFAYLTSYSDRYGFDGGPRCQPVSDGVRVYASGAGGALHCLDFATGQVLWNRDIAREFKTPQDFFGVGATPLIEDDKLIINVGAPGGPCVAGFDVKTGRLLWGAGKASLLCAVPMHVCPICSKWWACHPSAWICPNPLALCTCKIFMLPRRAPKTLFCKVSALRWRQVNCLALLVPAQRVNPVWPACSWASGQ